MYKQLLEILRCVVKDTELQEWEMKILTYTDWKELYRLAKRQGVTAVVFEKIKALPREVAPPKEVTMKWMSHSMSIERQTRTIYQRCANFAQLMHEQGLHTMVLKGVAASLYYPNQWHREYGDLDCYLYKEENGEIVWGGCYEEGNCIAEQAGYVVRRGFYKHSHIKYEGLEVENHQFSLPIKDGKAMKALERELRRLVELDNGRKQIGDTHMYSPSADFNALFLTAHAMSHFLYESIKLRHVMDWALFLQAEEDSVDWNNFWQWCERMHYTRFVQCMNFICVQYLGVVIHAFDATHDEKIKKLAIRMLKDIYEGDSLYTKGYKGLRFRIALAASYFKSIWKFHRISQQSALWLLMKRAMGMMVREVKLE